jgi:diguanylate cyclase (GGDEF)-like protein/PAS domain S-box-containing protein
VSPAPARDHGEALLEASSEGLLLVEPLPEGGLVIVHANAAAERLLDPEGRGLAGRSVEEALSGQLATALPALAHEALAATERRETEVAVGTQALDVRVVPLEGRLGVAVRAGGQLTAPGRRRPEALPPEVDERIEGAVSAARRARAALRESEERFRTLADSAPALIWTTDAEGSCEYLSEGWTRFTGERPGDRPGEAWMARVHPDDRQAVRVAWGEAARAGEPWQMEYRMLRADGSWRWMSDRGRPRRRDGRVVGHVGLCIDVTERRRAEELLREREAEQSALRRVATAVAAEADTPTVFSLVAEEVARLLGADGGVVSRFGQGRAEVVGVWASPDNPDHQRLAASVRALPLDGETAVARVFRTGRPARVAAHEGADDATEALLASSMAGGVAAPVRVGAELWGAVSAVTTHPEGPPEEAEWRLARFAELLSLGISNAEARERLAAQATTDPLTGLANHRVFHERLRAEVARAERHDRPLGLVVMDLDHFKQINDHFGHQVGDEVLVETARRLSSLARLGEVLARVGGEEFAWLLPEADAMAAYAAAERARRAIGGTPFPRVGRVTASAGVCELAQARGAAELFELADGALYWAKVQGRDVAYRYSPEVVEVLSASERVDRLARTQALAGLRALARAVDAKDPSTAAHSERVAAMAERLARALRWPADRTALLGEAGLLHDVGKIGVPDSVLAKPGPLTPAEHELVKPHAALGATIAGEVLGAEQVAWIRGHHERWDGAGYPDGLAADAIPDGARILALADAWDVMTAVRLYGEPLGPEAALAACRREAGRQFAPEAVAALARLLREGAPAPIG